MSDAPVTEGATTIPPQPVWTIAQRLCNMHLPACSSPSGCRCTMSDNPNCLANLAVQFVEESSPEPEGKSPSSVKAYSHAGLQNLSNFCYGNSCLQLLRLVPGFATLLYSIDAAQVALPPVASASASSVITPSAEVLAQREQERRDVANVVRMLQRLFATMMHSPTAKHTAESVLHAIARRGRWAAGAQQDITECDLVLLNAFLSPISNEFEQQLKRLLGFRFQQTVICTVCSERTTVDQGCHWMWPVPIVPGRDGVNLTELLSRFVRAELMTGDNRYRCTKCAEMRDAYNRTGIEIGSQPEVLRISLKRWHLDHSTGETRKVNDSVVLPLELDIAPYCIIDTRNPSSAGQVPTEYELTTIVRHLSNLSAHGHYYLDARMPGARDTDDWIRFNDRRVVPVSPTALSDDVSGASRARRQQTSSAEADEQQENSGDSKRRRMANIHSHTAYIAVYTRIDVLQRQVDTPEQVIQRAHINVRPMLDVPVPVPVAPSSGAVQEGATVREFFQLAQCSPGDETARAVPTGWLCEVLTAIVLAERGEVVSDSVESSATAFHSILCKHDRLSPQKRGHFKLISAAGWVRLCAATGINPDFAPSAYATCGPCTSMVLAAQNSIKGGISSAHQLLSLPLSAWAGGSGDGSVVLSRSQFSRTFPAHNWFQHMQDVDSWVSQQHIASPSLNKHLCCEHHAVRVDADERDMFVVSASVFKVLSWIVPDCVPLCNAVQPDGNIHRCDICLNSNESEVYTVRVARSLEELMKRQFIHTMEASLPLQCTVAQSKEIIQQQFNSGQQLVIRRIHLLVDDHLLDPETRPDVPIRRCYPSHCTGCTIIATCD